MRLVRIPPPFDHHDMLWEIKHDGFRAIADVRRNGTCTLTSRNGFPFQKWNVLAESIARDVQAGSVMLDGEIVCLDADGRSNFYDFCFVAPSHASLPSMCSHLTARI